MNFFSMLYIIIISLTSLWCNISSIENSFNYSMALVNQDTIIKDSSLEILNLDNSMKAYKSPMKAMLYSAILPGLGQAYMEKWKRGFVYLALEGVALGASYIYKDRAENKKQAYLSFAEDHWDFARWIQGYYKWESGNPPDWFEGDALSWNTIREVFVNNSDIDLGCDIFPYCYTDIWDHSHSVKFEWDGVIISSSNETAFKPIYIDLCGIETSLSQQSQSRECQIEDINIILESVNIHGGKHIKDHHFHEGIQKYPMYFAGWDDADDSETIDTNNNNTIITSSHQNAYQDIWSDYNKIKMIAERAGSYMLINRFVSIIDGLFLAKMWNDQLINLDLYPDLRNKSGLGGFRLTLEW